MQLCVDNNHMLHCNLSDHLITFARWRYDVGKISAGSLVHYIVVVVIVIIRIENR